MKTKIPFIAVLLLAGAPAFGTVVGNLSQASFNALGGQTTQPIVVSGIADNGVTFDLTFTFSTNVGTLNEGSRLGINSSNNQGANGNNAINEGEILSMDVAATVTGTPVGQVLDTLDFGVTKVDMVRAGPSRGSASYEWVSSAASFTSLFTSQTGNQSVETFDGASVFDIANAVYASTFTTNENGDTNVSGFRWRTDLDNVNFSVTATTKIIPEPTTAALGLMGLAGLVARRRRAA